MQNDPAKKLSDEERVAALEALLATMGPLGAGPRRDRVNQRALSQTIAEIKARDPAKATAVESNLEAALRGMENGKVDGEDFTHGSLRDVAIKTRKYWPMIREALRKWGFACQARAQGTAGGNDPADCDWPGCGCDPYAVAVLSRHIDQTGTPIDPGTKIVTFDPEVQGFDKEGRK